MTGPQLRDGVLTRGVHAAALIPVAEIPFDAGFRALCESNACGNYGACWMCPPNAGDIHTLIAHAKSFTHALVYQTVGMLEDSYDFEGMMAAAAHHNELAQKVRILCGSLVASELLHLGAGGCRVCPVCAKRTGEPCRSPELAMASLETYGVAVSELAGRCGMAYINGQNTVTYFGAVLWNE